MTAHFLGGKMERPPRDIESTVGCIAILAVIGFGAVVGLIIVGMIRLVSITNCIGGL
jgi:hypothetical protein